MIPQVFPRNPRQALNLARRDLQVHRDRVRWAVKNLRHSVELAKSHRADALPAALAADLLDRRQTLRGQRRAYRRTLRSFIHIRDHVRDLDAVDEQKGAA
ncbi:MAG: hypothetical protein JWO51_1082 [Rhodospirillales bacterium]|nr:hypothetical protein [Rhodospirillales bacterium]